MAKTKPTRTSTKAHNKKKKSRPQETPEELYDRAITLISQSQPEEALQAALKLLSTLHPNANSAFPRNTLPALNLIGEIYVELGDADEARRYFKDAVDIDPDGAADEDTGGGSEKFLWLAQLCESGGAESVTWFERGVAVLKREIAQLQERAESGKARDEEKEALEGMVQYKRERLAKALCGVVEIYMTDLSWESDAETRCEGLITEALLLSPASPEVLQTVASVRLSQIRLEDARAALARSIDLWKNLDPEDPDVPDFPTRISLARLLMEAEMEDEAMEVIERLVSEDDQSVEAWYLGGWCLHLLANKRKQEANGTMTNGDSAESKEALAMLKSSREWLLKTLNLYGLLEYEDARLKEHTTELVTQLNSVLGEPIEGAGEEEDDFDDGWEDEDVDGVAGDEEMEGA
ncbi:hypothetical protein LTR66_011032 [Elasticomyces elasticus]|nr:hypothetical protein LTR66_011032 [Elasticomyces elasticus]KAK4988971.1 hypothetical protein LTR50_003567 [Elasticomyces elasticus]